jgi:hypothetical protein
MYLWYNPPSEGSRPNWVPTQMFAIAERVTDHPYGVPPKHVSWNVPCSNHVGHKLQGDDKVSIRVVYDTLCGRQDLRLHSCYDGRLHARESSRVDERMPCDPLFCHCSRQRARVITKFRSLRYMIHRAEDWICGYICVRSNGSSSSSSSSSNSSSSRPDAHADGCTRESEVLLTSGSNTGRN